MIVEPVVPPHLKALSHAKRPEKISALLIGEVTQTQLKELDPGGGRDQLPDFENLGNRSRSLGSVSWTSRPRLALSGHGLAPKSVSRTAQLRNLMWSWNHHEKPNEAWVWVQLRVPGGFFPYKNPTTPRESAAGSRLAIRRTAAQVGCSRLE